MTTLSNRGALILGVSMLIGLLGLGGSLGNALLRYRLLERVVSVKGLSEQEHPANIVIWPIRYSRTANDLPELYTLLKQDADLVVAFLNERSFTETEYDIQPPEVIDKIAQNYGNTSGIEYRYAATQSVSVYTSKIEAVRTAIKQMTVLGNKGVALTGREYDSKPQYLFTRLNEIKPMMIEEATRNARTAATKFAEDAESRLGSIRSASQGQFTISDRDQSTPHIKRVRVVSTVQYYLE